MTQLTALEVADYWVAAGGPKSRATEWVAISLGESGYDTEAVSVDGAIGLWQIMPFNAAPNGVSVDDLYSAEANAHVAVRMSGAGTNCAAWDSCYANIEASGRYSFLGWPEVGSADYNNLAVVSAELGTDKLGGAVPPIGSTPSEAVVRSVTQMQTLTSKVYPALDKMLIANRMAVNATFTPRWCPWTH